MGCTWLRPWYGDAITTKKLEKYTKELDKSQANTDEVQASLKTYFDKYSAGLEETKQELRVLEPILKNASANLLQLRNTGKANTTLGLTALSTCKRLFERQRNCLVIYKKLQNGASVLQQKESLIAQTEVDQLDMRASAAVHQHLLKAGANDETFKKLKDAISKLDQDLVTTENTDSIKNETDERMNNGNVHTSDFDDEMEEMLSSFNTSNNNENRSMFSIQQTLLEEEEKINNRDDIALNIADVDTVSVDMAYN